LGLVQFDYDVWVEVEMHSNKRHKIPLDRGIENFIKEYSKHRVMFISKTKNVEIIKKLANVKRSNFECRNPVRFLY
jgi:hypothetical protein